MTVHRLISQRTGKPYRPHKYQLEVHKSNARFRLVIAGRRWGKTTMALMDLIKFMLYHPNSLSFWVVPLYKHLMPVSDSIREWIPYSMIKTKYSLQKTIRYLELKNGSRVFFHSCEVEDSLRGAGLDYVILEEAAQMRDTVYPTIILPELLDTNGKALIITTPKGKGNWIYQEYLRAKNDESGEYAVWRRPSTDRIDEKQLLMEKKRYPEDVFRQEFLAEFIENVGTVFRNVRKCFQGNVEEGYNFIKYSDGYRLVPKGIISDFVSVGIDVGRHEDFTVFSALDSSGYLVGFERFRKLDFQHQKDRLKAFLSHFPNRVVSFDARGIGESFYEELAREGIYMEGIKLTNPLKNELIHNLILKLDEEAVRGPYIEVLVDELEAFTYHMSSMGNPIYSAPSNMHDDCVMSLAFAAKNVHKVATDWISLKGRGYLSRRGEGNV